jgi:hypothetical protein
MSLYKWADVRAFMRTPSEDAQSSSAAAEALKVPTLLPRLCNPFTVRGVLARTSSGRAAARSRAEVQGLALGVHPQYLIP